MAEMELNDKIKKILVNKSISPSHFADEIGVQRSSVSHILSGRNRPSLDIVQKIIMRYPDLGMEWIMDNEELPEIEPDRSDSNLKHPTQATPESQNLGRSESSEKKMRDINPAKTNQITSESVQNLTTDDQNPIEKIFVFYADGTFREYIPQ